MSNKLIDIPPHGGVVVNKRKGNRNLRLSIDSRGQLRVSIPYWLPYKAAVAFVKSKTDWIDKHMTNVSPVVFLDGQRIGKSYRIKYDSVASPRISGTNILVPSFNTEIHNQKIILASERALKKQSEVLLVNRLQDLASRFGFEYKSLTIKKMRSRWGSCSSRSEISLSLYLVQLPWNLIDYVILHELTHTIHHNHSKDFWNHLESVCPITKQAKKELKNYQTNVLPQA